MSCYTTLTKAQGADREVRVFTDVRDNFHHEIPALVFLYKCSRQQEHKSHVNKMRSMFVRFSTGGAAQLTSELFHEAGKKDGYTIWRFSSGQLRIYCFYDGLHIVLSHGSFKKTQKTDDADLTQATAAAKKYFKGS